MRGGVEGQYVVVDDEVKCRDALRYVNAYKCVAVDCEGGNLGRAGTLCLVQVATPDHKAYLFDVADDGRRRAFFDMGLRRVLESRKVTKLMHDCRRDSDALWHHAQTKLSNVLDTQVAHAVVAHRKGRRVPLPAGLSAVLQLYLGKEHESKAEMHKEMDRDPSFWARRPLSAAAAEYAATDVLLMHALARKFIDDLDPREKDEWRRYSDAYTVILRYSADPDTVVVAQGVPLYGIADYDRDVLDYVGEKQESGSWKSNKDAREARK